MIAELFNKAPCGYFAFGDNGDIFQVNDALCDLLGYKKNELEGKNVEKIFTLATRIFYQTHFFPLVKMHGHAEEIFISLLAADSNHIAVLLNAKRVEWEGEWLTLCICITVPNRKKFEDELVAARNTALKALRENTNLIQAKEDSEKHAGELEKQMQKVRKQNHELQQFNHVVTHNLKEPLRKIILYSGKLQSANDSPGMQKLVKSAEQMRTTVSGLQQYVWLNEKSNRFSIVHLDKIINRALLQMKDELDTDLLELEIDCMIPIEADEDQLVLLFYHLLSNAIKFRKNEKAKVQINCVVLKQNTYRSVKGKYKYVDHVKIEVRDDGKGFDPDFREHVFDLFRKLHYEEGQGLGLALCKKIADNHNGSIEAETVMGQFTNIIIWLPVKQ